jgi:hypothetical protein
VPAPDRPQVPSRFQKDFRFTPGETLPDPVYPLSGRRHPIWNMPPSAVESLEQDYHLTHEQLIAALRYAAHVASHCPAAVKAVS